MGSGAVVDASASGVILAGRECIGADVGAVSATSRMAGPDTSNGQSRNVGSLTLECAKFS